MPFSEIVNLDNHYKKSGTNTVLSSEMIVEKFGGLENIVSSLHTNTKVSYGPQLPRSYGRALLGQMAHYRSSRGPCLVARSLWKMLDLAPF